MDQESEGTSLVIFVVGGVVLLLLLLGGGAFFFLMARSEAVEDMQPIMDAPAEMLPGGVDKVQVQTRPDGVPNPVQNLPQPEVKQQKAPKGPGEAPPLPK